MGLLWIFQASQSPRLVSGKLWESSGTVALTDREVMAMWRHSSKFQPSQIPNASYETTPWVPGLPVVGRVVPSRWGLMMSSGVGHDPSLSSMIIPDTYVYIIQIHYPQYSPPRYIIQIDIYIYIIIDTYIYIYMCTCIFRYIYIYTHVFPGTLSIHTYIYIYRHIDIYMYIWYYMGIVGITRN